MSLDPGTVHRFAMLERAVKSFAKTGRFDESLKLVEELLAIAPEDAGLSKLKARLAADLVKQAAQAQKISAATEILTLVDAKIPAAHLGEQEKALLSKSRSTGQNYASPRTSPRRHRVTATRTTACSSPFATRPRARRHMAPPGISTSRNGRRTTMCWTSIWLTVRFAPTATPTSVPSRRRRTGWPCRSAPAERTSR